jgi:predicted NodU family carbamoyl transferase
MRSSMRHRLRVASWRPPRDGAHRPAQLAGLLYFWATHEYGFTPHSDEYKLMGMTPYADPRRAGEVTSRRTKAALNAFDIAFDGRVTAGHR